MTALVLEWQRVDAIRTGWVPQPAAPSIPAAIVGPPGESGNAVPSEPVIAAGTPAQYWRGDKNWATLDKAAVALGNVDNSSDASKPVSTAQAAAIALKLNAAAVSAFGLTLVDDADAAAARGTLGLGTLATQSGSFSGTSSGTNTGDQTSVSGNAGSATVLQTARTINGVPFNGSANITVTIAAASGAAAGSMSAADFTKLATIASGATANSADAVLLARANHTGTQGVATISGNWPVAQLNSGVGANAATFWRGDGSWATPGGSADPITHTQAPVLPFAGSISVGERTLANREILAVRGALWPEELMQGRLDRMGWATYRAVGNSTAIDVTNTSALTVSGTATARNVASASLATRAIRVGAVSAATAAAVAGWFSPIARHALGDGAGLGGFLFVCRFVPSDAAAVIGARMFVGLTSSIAAPANVEPSTLTNAVGVAALAGSSNLNIVFGGSAAQTPIDLGANFPANGLSSDIYELVMCAPPGAVHIYWQVTRNPGGPANSFTASGTLTNTTPGTTLPASSTFLAPRLWRTNNTTALAVAIDLMSLSIETTV